MKVYVNPKGELRCLRWRLFREGNELCQDPAEAELVIPDPRVIPARPGELGLEESDSTDDGDYHIIKYFNDVFSPQTYLSLALRGMMNRNLGLEQVSGSAGRFVPNVVFEKYFEGNPILNVFLREYKYKGFVSFECCEGRVREARLGIPSPHVYAMLEGRNGPLVDVFTSRVRLLESWSGGLIVSRHPFPQQNTTDTVHVMGLHEHFWPSSFKPDRTEFKTQDTWIGVGTGWSMKLHDLANRTANSCHQILAARKQYRTDLEDSIIVSLDLVRKFHKF